MADPKMDLFVGLAPDEWTQARKMIIDMILATEMGRHFDLLGRFRVKALSNQEINLSEEADKLFVLSIILKCSDLGHSAKATELHVKWSKRVWEEFFA